MEDALETPGDVLPVGDCEEDEDFGPGGDEITYSIAGLTGPGYTVTVELRHQAIGWPYVEDLRNFEEEQPEEQPEVRRFLDLYDSVLPGSEVMAELEFDSGD